MSRRHVVNSTRVGIKVGLIVLALGLVGEIGWLALRLPGAHWTPVAASAMNVVSSSSVTSTEVLDSYADLSFVPSLVAGAIGFLGGFWQALTRQRAETLGTP